MATLLRNIELKTRCAELDRARQTLESLGATSAGIQRQTDTYFRVPSGRLKLREVDGKGATLIWYDRPDGLDFRASNYRLVPVADPAALEHALQAACGIRGRVHKLREIYL